ncbi:MAG: hypothetical protein RLZZ387_1771 [Chloroflexota bacterium]|jgi:uncharacterized Zn finger protein
MTSQTRLSEAEIRSWAGDVSVQRGRPYVRNALFHTRRTGSTLKASCEGRGPQAYRVEATLGAAGVESASCTCPVGFDGRCKHVAALLLAWADEPELFIEVEDTAVALERRGRAELVALVQQMLTQYPDLELLLELPPPSSGADRRQVEPAAVRRQVDTILRHVGSQWGAASAAADRLYPLAQTAQSYLQLGEISSAAQVFESLTSGILQRYPELSDDDGELQTIVVESITGLGTCLAAAEDPALRQAITRSLLDTCRWDAEYGGIGVGAASQRELLAHTRGDERRRLAEEVRAALPHDESWQTDYERETLGGLLIALEGDALDDEAFLRICAETGRDEDFVARLLERGRTAEALDTAAHAAGPQLLALADLLRERALGDEALALVRARAARELDIETAVWLKERAVERADLAEAAELTLQILQLLPNPVVLEEARSLAWRAGTWDTLRPPLLERLRREQRYELLIEAHLAEDEVREALALAPHATRDQAIRIAQVAEHDFPRDAVALYSRVIEQLIEERGRLEYAAAAGYLARAGALSARIGEEAAWKERVAKVRREHRRLRALQEELTRAGIPS